MGKQITHQIFSTIMYGHGYGYTQQAPVTWAQPSYAQSTHEYLGPAKVLNWTPTERELLDRTVPESWAADADRSRDSIYGGMNEYERETLPRETSPTLRTRREPSSTRSGSSTRRRPSTSTTSTRPLITDMVTTLMSTEATTPTTTSST